MERLESVATTLAAATVTVPDSVPLPGLAPMATFMLAMGPVTVLLLSPRNALPTAGAMETPATAFVGWTVNASLVAAAGVMLNAAEVVPVSPAEAAVSV